MKRIVCILLLFLLVLCSCERTKDKNTIEQEFNIDLKELSMEEKNGVAVEAIDRIADITSFKTAEEVDSFISAPCVCLNEEKLYVVRNFPEELRDADSFYKYIDSGESMNVIEVYESGNFDVPSEEIKLSGYDFAKLIYSSITYSDKTFYITSNAYVYGEYVSYLLIFDDNGSMTASYELPFNVSTPHHILDGAIYTCENNKLYRYSIPLNTDNGSNMITDSVETFFISDNNLYFIKKETTDTFDIIRNLYSYSADNDSIDFIMNINTDELIESAAYDSVNEILYFSNVTDIYSYKDGKLSMVIGTVGSSTELIQIEGSEMIAEIGHNQLILYSLPATQRSVIEEYVIKVCIPYKDSKSYATNFDSTLDFMKANGISVRLEFSYTAENSDEYINTMAKKLMAGDTDFDIFYVDTGMNSIIKKKYYEDLGEYPILDSYFDKMVPGLSDICTIEGKHALVPTHVSVQSMRYDLNMKYDMPNDFNDIMNTVKTKDIKQMEQYYFSESNMFYYIYPWMEEIAANYMAGVIDYNDAKDDVEKILSFTQDVVNSDIIYLGENAPEQNCCIYVFQNPGQIHSQSEEHSAVIPIVKLDENYKNSAACNWLAINPKSTHKNIAAAFLAYYMEGCIRDYNLYTARFYKEGIAEEDIGTENKYAAVFWEQLSDSVRAVSDTELKNLLFTDISDYIEGNASPDKTVDVIMSQMKMMRNE